MKWHQVKLFVVCSSISLLINFQYGFSTTYLNNSILSFKSYLNSSFTRRGIVYDEYTYSWTWNLVLNIYFIGSFSGMIIAPFINDKFGRKGGFWLGTTCSLTASLLRFTAILAQLPELLLFGRVIASFTVALTYQSLVLYLQECSPTKYRGMISFTSEISFALMCTLGMALGTDAVFGKKLYYLTAVPTIPGILAVIILLFIPETPKFLHLVRKNADAACASIRYFHGEEADVNAIISAIDKESEADNRMSSIREIIRTSYLRRAILTSCLALQNTVPFWALLVASTYFLTKVNLDKTIAEWSSTAMTVLYTIGSSVGFLIVERLPRRRLLIIFSSSINIILIIFAILHLVNPYWDGSKYGCLFCMLIYGLFYGTGVGPPSWILCTELVPQRHRSLVQSTCYTINAIIVAISSFTILPLYNAIGAYAFLILYVVPSTLSIFYLQRNLPETKNREIYLIVEELRDRCDKTKTTTL